MFCLFLSFLLIIVVELSISYIKHSSQQVNSFSQLERSLDLNTSQTGAKTNIDFFFFLSFLLHFFSPLLLLPSFFYFFLFFLFWSNTLRALWFFLFSFLSFSFLFFCLEKHHYRCVGAALGCFSFSFLFFPQVLLMKSIIWMIYRTLELSNHTIESHQLPPESHQEERNLNKNKNNWSTSQLLF